MSNCVVQCPPACDDLVFDRVVVSYLVAGGAKVSWELTAGFTDPRPLVFQLQAGRVNNQDADDWVNVGLPVEDMYFAIDPEQRVFGNTNFTHYRVKLTTVFNVYYSQPTFGLGVLDRRDWAIGGEIIRQRKLIYGWGEGQNGYLLKRRWSGKSCTVCADFQTEESRNPNCPSCYGTGFECGYYFPVGCVYAKLSPRSHHTHLDGQMRGTTNDVFVSAEMLATDFLSEEDVWVNAKTDDRWYVHKVTHKAEIRGVPLVSDVELRLVPFSSAIYTIQIPQQLAALEA